MSVVHVTEAEAIRDIETLLAKVERGDEVQIERGFDRASISITLRERDSSTNARAHDPEEDLQHLSEFRRRHPEPLDSSKWD